MVFVPIPHSRYSDIKHLRPTSLYALRYLLTSRAAGVFQPQNQSRRGAKGCTGRSLRKNEEDDDPPRRIAAIAAVAPRTRETKHETCRVKIRAAGTTSGKREVADERDTAGLHLLQPAKTVGK